MCSKFKSYLFSLSLLIGVTYSKIAFARAPISNVDSNLIIYDKTIAQLERVSNAHGQLLIQLQQQFADNQRDIEALRGQIQENEYQLSQMRERQQQIDQQINSFSSLSAACPVENQSQFNTAFTHGNDSSNTAYNEALAMTLEKKQHDKAISAFQNFIKHYPDSIYQPNANYWLGQLNYNKGKKNEAAYYFALLVKKYPKSPKSPDALLKIGIIMQEEGHKDKARAIYRQVGKQYPSADAAKLAQKRLNKL